MNKAILEKARKILPLVKLFLLLLVFLFLYLRLRDAFTNLSPEALEVNLLIIFGSFAVMLGYQCACIGLWQFLTCLYNLRLPLLETAAIWSYSVLGKYVPGKALLWGLRFGAYKERHSNFRPDSIVHCFLLEYLSGIIAGVLLLLVSFFLIPVQGFSGPMLTGAVIILLASLITIHPKILHGVTIALMKRFSVSASVEQGLFKDVLKTVAFSIANWLILGLSIYTICVAVDPVYKAGGYLYVAASYAFAGLAGFLAFFAPSGIGVREAILIEALSYNMALEEAALVAGLARVVSTTAELGSALLFAMLSKTFQFPRGRVM